MIEIPALVPELDVADLAAALRIYRDAFGFELLFERPEEAFAYVVLGRAHLMLQQANGSGRRFRTAPLERHLAEVSTCKSLSRTLTIFACGCASTCWRLSLMLRNAGISKAIYNAAIANSSSQMLMVTFSDSMKILETAN